MTQEENDAAALIEASRIEKIWRDSQLKKTDWICATPDHGLHASYMTYRQKLRDWPSLDTFPSASSRPTL